MANHKNILQNWLHHPATGRMVLNCFRGMASRGRSMGFPEEIWPYEVDSEVAGMCWLLLQKKSSIPPQTLVALILAENWGAVCNYLKEFFIRRHRDWLRTGLIDPWTGMYRIVRKALAETRGITYRSEFDKTWYAWSLEPDLPKDALPDTDFSGWPKAPQPEKTFRSQATARDMARFVWEQEVKRSGRPKLLPVRAVVEYLQTHFPVEFEKPQRIDLDPLTPEEVNPLEQVPDPTSLELEFTRNHLPDIADACACSLSPRQRSIFLFRLEEELKLEQIASKLGVSIATVSNELQRISDRLRQQCSLWCGLAADDFDENLFFEFSGSLIQVCKKRLEDRL